MKRKILSLALCSALALLGASAANAKEIQGTGFTDLKTQYQISDTTILTYAYNIESDYPGKFSYQSKDESQLVQLNFIDSVGTPQMVNFVESDNFSIDFGIKADPSGFHYSLKNKGGTYRKVKIKLSDFAPHYFTEDGSLIFQDFNETQTYTENFKKKYDEDGAYYNATLFIQSGAAHTAVIPDVNGEVEFYLYLKPLEKTSFYGEVELKAEKYSYSVSNFSLEVYFGDVNKSYNVDVDDITEIQFALAGLKTLDDYGKFNADINADGTYDVQDVTDLQFALVRKVR